MHPFRRTNFIGSYLWLTFFICIIFFIFSAIIFFLPMSENYLVMQQLLANQVRASPNVLFPAGVVLVNWESDPLLHPLRKGNCISFFLWLTIFSSGESFAMLDSLYIYPTHNPPSFSKLSNISLEGTWLYLSNGTLENSQTYLWVEQQFTLQFFFQFPTQGNHEIMWKFLFSLKDI